MADWPRRDAAHGVLFRPRLLAFTWCVTLGRLLSLTVTGTTLVDPSPAHSRASGLLY